MSGNVSHRRFAVWLVLAVAAGLVAGCGGDGTVGAPSGVVLRVEIQGPASLAPGQSAHYEVIERLSNGTSRSQPSATWTSSDSSVVKVTSSGIATAQSGAGGVLLTAITTKSGSKEVGVLPSNTFRLVGSVTDTQGGAIPDARIEVIGGPSATTGSDGAYRLYGVPREADVRVTRGGYLAVEQHIQWIDAAFNFRMPVDVVDLERRNLGGDYTLTLEAASSCGSSKPLAVELRRRSYDANVTQDGLRLQGVLTEQRFEPWTDNAGRFSGTVTPDGARFEIGMDPAHWFSDLVERLPDGSTLEINGTAKTTGSSGVLSGAFSGWFSHGGPSGWLGDCDGSRFTLSPRNVGK